MRPVLAGAAGRVLPAALAFVAALVLLAPPATAANDKYWTDGSGQWDDSANWNPSGQPQAGDRAHLMQSDSADLTVTYYNTTNPKAYLDSLRIDATGLGTMTLDMPNDHALHVTTEYVGHDGKGAVTQSAGTHYAGTLYLGRNAAGEGTYTLSGGTLSGTQYVGYLGTGTLTIKNGGQVSSGEDHLGYLSGSTGTATVTGDGSKWTSSYSLYVGRDGAGTLNIEAGGLVSNTWGYLGRWSGSIGTATVTGAGSTWANSIVLYVGYRGTGTLTVTDGGLVSARTLYASPSDLLGNGTITAHGAVLDADLVFDSTHGLTQALAFGAGGTLNLSVDGTGDLGAGHKGTGTLRIAAGRTVASDYGCLGYRSGSTGTATVTGDGSTWTNSGSLYVGDGGTGTLNIEAGGRVNSFSGLLGFYDPASAGTATVTGDGSTWTNSNAIYVGYDGNGTLNVEAGGRVSSTWGHLGYSSGSTGTATVTGDGATWTISGSLDVGEEGTGTLNIEAGGRVSNSNGHLGCDSGSTGTATVTGAGSTWTNSGDLYVGYYRGSGTLTVTDGGRVTAQTLHASPSDLFGNGTIEAHGAVLDTDLVFDGTHGLTQALAFGAGGTLNLNVDGTGGLGAGFKGAGTLRIADGQTVASTYGYLGYWSGSTGQATVDGIGSVWNNTASLDVGGSSMWGAGGKGSVTVRSGGQLVVGEILKLWHADSAVIVNAGTLTAGALEGTTGTVRITDPPGGAALTVGSAVSATFSAALRDDTGPGSLAKVGAGTQTLSGAGITYTGTTTVLAGKLKLSNATAFASGILNSAATEFAVSSGTWTFGNALGGTGLFTKSGSGTLVVAGPQDYAPGALFNLLGGAMVLNTDAGSQGAHLSASVTGAELRFASNQHLDTLTVGGGGKVVFASANCGVLRHLANAGTIDLAAAALVVDYDGSTPLADIRTMLASGCAGGLWNGPGIHSSAAAADLDRLTALGILDNANPEAGGKTTFEGEPVDATSVLVKFTWWGDANLDGVVDANDYDVIDKMFLFPPVPDNRGWWTGDFNYDGVIDANDYDLIDRAFLLQRGTLAAGDVAAPTPEPATLALVILGAAALAARRRA